MAQAQTALHSARNRFVEALPGRALELSSSAERLARDPSDPDAMEALQRRLHALMASAQVFEERALVLAVQDLVARLDGAQNAGRVLSVEEIDSLIVVVASLPTYIRPSQRPPSAHSDVHELRLPEQDVRAAEQPVPPASEPAPARGVPVLLEQTVAGLLPAPRPAIVMVVDSEATAVRMQHALPATGFELVHASSADAAVRLLHEAAPDLVFVSAELASQPELDLVRRLKTDPLSQHSGVHVLLPEDATHDEAFLRQTGADGVVREPLDARAFTRLLDAQSERSSSEHRLFGLSEGTVDEIATQVAEEIRRGIAESLRAGKHERVRVGDGSELMEAAWSAIGRVRSHLAEQNRGRLRFREDTGPVTLLPSATGELAAPVVHPGQLLAGCRVLVADDDPAVLWFFAGLLKEASAQVLTAHNGREALEIARRKQPHVVVSDILMPKLDGFGLCRELKRDALLSQVPVILLSWKDDLLQRMRELDAGAAGYLRKEAGSKQILGVLSDVLRPRTQLIAHLRTSSHVSGPIEGIGPAALLELVAAERADSRIVVRDAWSLFEVDIRAGRNLSVTRTASDGSFTRGEKALMQLLGLCSGRFDVSHQQAPLRGALAEPLDRAVAIAGRKLAALLESVSDARLLRVSLIAFDDEVLQSLLAAPSTRLHEVVALFRTGNATAEAVLREGGFAPAELEGYLRELARRLAISGVWNAQGDDLVAAAHRDREAPPLSLLTSSRPASRPPPAMIPVLEPPAVAPLPAARRPGDRETPSVPLDPVFVEAVALAAREPEVPPHSNPAPDALDRLTVPSLEPVLSEQPREDAQHSDAVTVAERRELDIVLENAVNARRNRGEGVRLAGTLVMLVAVGYFGWQQVTGSQREIAVQATDPVTVESAASVEPTEPSGSEAGLAPALANAQFGKVLPFVDPNRGVTVGADQGLFVVDYTGDGQAPNLRVGDRDLGQPPIAVALPAGRHEVILRSKDNSSFRYMIQRAGETRLVTLP